MSSAILQLAERLGKAIAESAEAETLRTARRQMQAEEGLEQTLKDYQGEADKIAKLQDQNKPIEVDDKHKLEELQSKLLGSDAFKKYTAAQVEYVDLMRKVNESIRQQLAETEST